MDYMELLSLRRLELQPKVPSWAMAERMEASVPQFELWENSVGFHGCKGGKTGKYMEGKAS